MDVQPHLDAVYAAVQTLHHSTTDQDKASQWLADLQSSVSFICFYYFKSEKFFTRKV